MKKGLFVLACLLVMSSFASATIVYSDFVGTNVSYLSLLETTLSGDPEPLYGAPQLGVSDFLLFLNISFCSCSSDGSSDITDGKLDGLILSNNKATHYIDKICLQEFGDVTLVGDGTSAATEASVPATLYVTALEVGWVADVAEIRNLIDLSLLNR